MTLTQKAMDLIEDLKKPLEREIDRETIQAIKDLRGWATTWLQRVEVQ